jgi:ABC-type glutathione transport system ATPase component
MTRQIQLILQDTSASLDPRLTIRQILEEPLVIHPRSPPLSRVERRGQVVGAMNEVGLAGNLLNERPSSLSGGERQRVAIARALLVRPRMLLLDEPVSALDVSVRAGVLNLLARIREEQGLTMVFVSHDLPSVHFLCDKVLVMQSGNVVDSGYTRDVFSHPSNGYTQSLILATPRLIPE